MEVIKRGHYTITKKDNGSYKIEGPGIRKYGRAIPSAERVRALAQQENPGISQITLSGYIQWHGLIAYGKRSADRGREALGLPVRTVKKKDGSRVPLLLEADIIKCIRSFWTEEELTDYFEKGEENIKTIQAFRKKHGREYNLAMKSNRHSSLQVLMQRAYPQYPDLYLESYKRLTSRLVSLVDEKKIGQELRERIFYHGLAVDLFSLIRSQDYQERRLGRKVRALAKHHRHSFLKEVSALTGLKKEEVSLISSARHQCAGIAENLTRFFFIWAGATDYDYSDIVNHRAIYLNGQHTKFTLEGEFANLHPKWKKSADIRIGNTAIDGKTGATPLTYKLVRDALSKYSAGKSMWATGEFLDQGVLILHQERKFYAPMLPTLEEHGIKVVSYEQFHTALAGLLSYLKLGYSHIFENFVPRIHNINYLLTLHESVSLEARLREFIRPGNYEERAWSSNVLENLVEEGLHYHA